MIILVVAVTVSLSISFFCSLMEACVLSISTSNIAEIARTSPKTGAIWKQFKANIQKPIAVILIINTLAHTIGAAISGAQFDELYGPKLIWLFSLAYSLFMIQYTEILPKTLGVRFNTIIARSVTIPMRIAMKLFGPLISLIELANRPFEGSTGKATFSVIDEISLLASSAVLDKTLSQEQASLITKSVQMSSRRVRDIMVPADQVIFLDASMSLNDAFLASHVHRHTRYPLRSSDDNGRIIGYVNFKDLVTALHIAPEDPTLTGICRPIRFIAEDMPLNILLRSMIREYQHIAMVSDKRGNLTGLITLEDVIESLVGTIEDEYDRPPVMMVRLAEHRWRIGGGVMTTTVREKITGELPDIPGTIDDLVKSRLQGVELKENHQLRFGGISMKIRRVSRGFVYDVVIEKSGPARK